MPPDFDPLFQIPNWGWWIVLYFFAGGVTGGVYFAAAWLDLFGEVSDRPAVRLGHLIAFPLIIVSSLFLIVDLGQPLRFWHMLFQSESFPALMLKPYSPMSFGSLILFLFGLVAFISFVDAVLGSRILHSPGNPIGKVVSAIGAIAGLALAGYTGVLLNVTNEPAWGNSPWISALFLFSGVSTGIATLHLFARRVSVTTVEKLSEADNYMMLFELITLVVFLLTLGAVGTRFIFGTPTVVLFLVVIVVGVLAPLVIHWRPGLAGGIRGASVIAAVLVLVGGFVLRWAVLAIPQGIGL
jgi:protein NrfD